MSDDDAGAAQIQRPRWLSGELMRMLLTQQAADPDLRRELDTLVGDTPADL